jgi:excisionase family DNA binding protein
MTRKEFLTPNEVAKLLMVSPITVRQWAQKGLLAAHTTVGGHRRFAIEAVAAFARERGIELPGITQRLLIVDDNRQFNNFLADLFSTEVPGLPIHQAFDGFEAGRAVQQHRPSVMLLDVMMPGVDGLEVCRSLKSDSDTADIRVIAMTGHHSPDLERKMRSAGADVLLKKPFSAEEVLRECGFRSTSNPSRPGGDPTHPGGDPTRPGGGKNQNNQLQQDVAESE